MSYPTSLKHLFRFSSNRYKYVKVITYLYSDLDSNTRQENEEPAYLSSAIPNKKSNSARKLPST